MDVTKLETVMQNVPIVNIHVPVGYVIDINLGNQEALTAAAVLAAAAVATALQLPYGPIAAAVLVANSKQIADTNKGKGVAVHIYHKIIGGDDVQYTAIP
jgi:hypothetical protein